jgi:hypothetical protein
MPELHEVINGSGGTDLSDGCDPFVTEIDTIFVKFVSTVGFEDLVAQSNGGNMHRSPSHLRLA